MKQRVLSGIRATNRLHLGNYLGAVRGMIELQNANEYETLFMVADLHAITTPFEPQELNQYRREVLIDYLAAGLNPEKSILFLQADVPEHLELAFYFSSVVTIAKMQHLPTFKEKVKQHPTASTMALLNYPILMAADILIYQARLVPVGIDQEPHLEVAREIAKRMNQQYGTEFPFPKRFKTPGEYVPSLKGVGKMAKSVAGSAIDLTDSKEIVQKKIRAIPTATTSGGTKSPGIKTLFALAELFIPEETDQFELDYQKGLLKFQYMKDTLAGAISETLSPIQEKREELLAHPKRLEETIADGAQKARSIAKETLRTVREKMGLV